MPAGRSPVRAGVRRDRAFAYICRPGTGAETGTAVPLIEPAVTYRMILPQGTEPAQAMERFSQLGEEDPALHIRWDERAGGNKGERHGHFGTGDPQTHGKGPV